MFNISNLSYPLFFYTTKQYPFTFLSVIMIKCHSILIPSCDFTKLINGYGRISNNKKEKKFEKILNALFAPHKKNRFKFLLNSNKFCGFEPYS